LSFKSSLAKFKGLSDLLGRWFNHLAIVSFLIMLFVTFLDVLGAKLFRFPLPGSLEIISLAQIVAILGTAAVTQKRGDHVRVEIVVDHLPQGWRSCLNTVTSVILLVLFCIIGWQGLRYAQNLIHMREVSGTAAIPLYPFALWITLSCIPMCLVLVWNILHSIVEGGDK
jgi:TRAP-type C4-dicarboxylate transport system permease small subunit